MKTTLRSTFSKIATAWSGCPRSFSSAATAGNERDSRNSFRRSAFSSRFTRSIEAAALSAALGASAWSCSPSRGQPILPISDAADDIELDGVCKTVAGAAPEVVVGQGQSDYFPLADLDEVTVEAGPQGGHHIWLALRVKNLLRSGSRTTLTGIAPDTQTNIAPYEVIYTFDPAEGGYCKLFGLRFQLDLDGVDYVPLLGRELDVTATVTDRSGDTGRGTRRVMLAPM